MVATCLETASQFTIGQFFIRMLDRGIGIVEKTAQWSLPRQEIMCEENGKSFNSIELVRPLPWILFLPSLVILRGFRFVWNIGAFVIGYSEISPGHIVKSLQKVRRRLRAIRMNGVRRMQKIKPASTMDQSLGLNEAKQSLLRSIQLTLSTLSCFDASKMKSSPPPMRIRVPMNYDSTPVLDDKSTVESTMLTRQCETKRKYTEVSSDDPESDEESESEEMTFNTKLSHYEMLNSSDDPDFHPGNSTGETNDLEESLNEDTHGTDEEEVDKLIEEARQIMMDDDRKTNAEMPEEQILAVVNAHLQIKEKKTVRNGNGNCVKNDSDDLQNYYSPCKSIEDADMAFYSPISSKSTSPERETFAHHDDDNEIVQQSRIKGTNTSAKLITNEVDELNCERNKNEIEIEKKDDELQLDSSEIKGKQQRQNLKGKRSTHGNRKKKV
ncbi:hypothetical protein PV328_009219 [Microctonus aethiopoides]|uniref:Uncharacterized protein n=1 Tax=Microctonus aethiopoides TaxID=144406 RepID=A0AA39C5C1_9HYME|nr:hypothetical protein PV328_009219 [Microctonus aethiopoides]